MIITVEITAKASPINKDGYIDYDKLEELARDYKPRMIIVLSY